MSSATQSTTGASVPAFTPAQRRTFEDLLAAGHERPTCPSGLAERLQARVGESTADALSRWTEPSLFATKSFIEQAASCEGLLVANREQPQTGEMLPAVAVGIVSHQAIQLAHTHPGRSVDDYVGLAITGTSDVDDRFATMWRQTPLASQSNLMTQMVSKVASFLDTFPPLNKAWTPQFEHPIQAKVGRLTLSARPDLMLGRPRADGRQTVLIVDFKTGALHERHDDEAAFYALVATLRHGVAPFRSTVLSLASGEWSDPEVDEARLMAAADRVGDAVARSVDVLIERRLPTLTPGDACRFCPARDTCPEALVDGVAPKAPASPDAKAPGQTDADDPDDEIVTALVP